MKSLLTGPGASRRLLRRQTPPARRFIALVGVGFCTALICSFAFSALPAQASTAAQRASLVRAAAAPAATAVVIDGNARFEVLSPTVIRLEYAGDGAFQDGTTLNVINRGFAVPAYTTDVSSDGYREIKTSGLALRYKEGSGPFAAGNLSVAMVGTNVTAAAAFPSTCAVSTACEAEDGLLGGAAKPAYDHNGYTGTGFVAGFEATGASMSQDIVQVPSSGSYRLAVRYANGNGNTRSLSTKVNGAAGPALSLPATASWDAWSTTSVTVNLTTGENNVTLLQNAGDSSQVNVDSIAITPASTTTYPGASTLRSTGYGVGPTNTLGGWDRALDNPAALPTPEHPGVLDQDGWYLLDDTRTPLLSAGHAITDRPSHGAAAYQDGYFFGYGQNYKQGLADLNALTGGTALLPQSAYGVWYSRYYPYSAADYENTVLPAFRSTATPIDWLVTDTDWKSPNNWNGWNWNTTLFPDPQGYVNWTTSQGLSLALNIHPTIDSADPKFAATNSAAGGLTQDGTGTTHKFDWSKPAQLSAFLSLHQPFEQQGVREWWLDACCDSSAASDPHVASDNVINQAYADDSSAKGVRGFAFSRIGGSDPAGDNSTFALGPWSERRNTLQFTGDTPATWAMMTFEAQFTADEAAAGLGQVSDDIGSYHGGHLADDMYARWVQLGTFQPIDRLHSDHGDRLPWNYTGAAAASAETFLRLRESLVPYTYTLADQAHNTGTPIVEPLYLDYPASSAAYTFPGEYLYGDNVLVAPITSPNDANGNGSTQLWVPPGSWTDYFTGQTYTGPATVTITDPLSEMPVLIKAGGILPTRTDYVDNAAAKPLTALTINVAGGANGSFSLYQDTGEGTAYQNGQSTSAPLSWADATHTLTIGAQTGSYTGAPTARSYTLHLSNSAAPATVLLDGVQVPQTAWAWNAGSRTVTIRTASLPLSASHTISLSGSAAASTGPITAGVSPTLCMDDNTASTTNGTAIQLYTCHGGAAQQFTFTANTLQVVGKCVDVSGGATANGTLVQLYDCNGTGAQTWQQQPNGSLLNPSSGKCLDDPAGSTTLSTQLEIWTCNGGTNQIWHLTGTSTGTNPAAGPIMAGVSSSLCIDDNTASTTNGTAIQLYTCNTALAQQWTTAAGNTLQVLGKCMDATAAGLTNGTKIELYDCNGTGAQVWQPQPNGSLLNPQSGRCLDDPASSTTTGTQLDLWDCNGGANQKWTLPAG